MSVYTELDQDTLTELCEEFGVTARSFTPIGDGVENSNWFVSSTRGEFVLTLFEERGLKEVRMLCNLLEALDQMALPVALPLMHELDARCSVFDDKPLILSPRIEGTHPKVVTLDQCETMGAVLAKLHEHMAKLPATQYALPAYPFHASLVAHLPHLPEDDAHALSELYKLLGAQRAKQELPHGLTHSDLFVDNTLWQGDVLTGILDFTEVCIDELLSDFAICANDFCTLWEDKVFDLDRYARFLRGYQSVRPLERAELQHMQLYLAGAASRFWLMRLDKRAEFAEKPAGEFVQIKSPDDMRWLTLHHLQQVKTYQPL